MTRSFNSSSHHSRNYNRAELENSLEKFTAESAQNFDGFSDREKEYIYQNVDNMKNFVATKPFFALSGLKFPEKGGQISDENFNFEAELMWNENIDQMVNNLKKSYLPNEKLQETITQIQEILSGIIVLHSLSHQYSENVKDNISSILEG